MATTLTLDLTPADVLFFRDGRPFDTGRVDSGLPLPQTLAGALRTHLMSALGCDFAALAQALQGGRDLSAALAQQSAELAAVAQFRLAGPWLARDDEVLLSTPASLHRKKDGDDLYLLAPLGEDLPGWTDDAERQGARPLWLRKDVRSEPAGGFIALSGLQSILNGETPDPGAVRKADDLFAIEHRTGIGITPGGSTAAEGQIYTAGFLRLRPGVRFRAELSGVSESLAAILRATAVLRWGGEGRQVHLTCRESAIDWPKAPADGGDGAMVVLTAPALLDGGWRQRDWRPVTAAVDRPVPVSGWDLARRGPKPTRFAVPAGSVFFFDRDDPACPDGPFVGANADGLLGYGCYVKGGWRYA